ncbi:MAG TPA: 2OG-Fe dioxygenase family protein [Vicinamibacterales bacterium]|jgi:hypothetical protein|nr:2OG-Fe dioxygenase family protein [Vicinamibacterales bacterium]
MNGATATTSEELHASVEGRGFAFVEGTAMRDLLLPFGSLDDWAAFAASWERLALDTYMADGGRYRRRRHATFSATGPVVTREAHQPHFQTVDYNPLNGGVARWFEPIDEAIGAGPTMTAMLGFCRSLFSDLAPATKTWQIEVHQFRIEARNGAEGRPTPEGLHRDGVDYVLVLLVDRRNIASGVTGIHSLDGEALGQFTLTDALDSAIVNDHRVAHGVTAVEPLDPSLPAHRDVLVVTFKTGG